MDSEVATKGSDLIGIIGVVLGAVLVWGSEYFKAHFAKKSDRQYLAIRIIPILERLLDSAYDCAFDEGTVQGLPGRGGIEYEPQVKAPQFSLPDDVNWKSLDAKLLQKILFLDGELYATNRRVDGHSEHAIPPFDDFMYDRQYEYSKFALRCDEVLTEVRKLLMLEAVKYEEYWNPRERCQKFVQKYEA